MKNLIPVAVIAVMGILTFTSSCKKKSETKCTCVERGTFNQDSTVSFSTVDSQFTSLAEECAFLDTLLKFDSARYGCHL